MKTLKEVNSLLDTFRSRYDINVADASQGSEAWFKLKLGVVSASNISKVVAKKDSETRFTYLCDLVAQICTGQQEEINAKALEWGKMYEAPARSSYEFEKNIEMIQVPFVFMDDKFREGASPDGILPDRGSEIKCSINPSNYIKFLSEERIKPEWQWQCQYQMRVLECNVYDMCQYHPLMKVSPLKVVEIEKDEKMQSTLNDAVPQFIFDIDTMLEKIGVRFGSQWS